MADRITPPELPHWLAAQLPFERYLVDVGDGRQIHVMEQGEGRPVVMFHGNPTWGYLYRKVARELAGESFRLIMPDLMDLGLSDRIDLPDFTLQNHIGWMSGMLEMLEVEDAIVVVQDWGGPIGLGAMARHPGAMSGLVVMNTSIGPPKPGFKPTTFHRAFGNRFVGALSTRLGILEKNMARAQGDRRSISGVVRDSYLYPLRERGNQAVVRFVRMVPDTMDHPSIPSLQDVGEFVAGYPGPAAIVWGVNDPVLGKLIRRVSRTIPQATVTATAAGHFLQEEVPRDIAAAIRSVA